MGRTFELGSWDGEDQLTDRLHDHFEKSGLTDWLQIAERGDAMREHYSLGCRPVLYAVAAQSWEGALQDFATRANFHAPAFLDLMRDVRESRVADFPANFLQIIAHGNVKCDHAECWICNGGERT
jgi:hypothetical protein